MQQKSFKVIFIGVVQDGLDPVQVRKNIADLFRLEPNQAAQLFSGERITVKQNVDLETAMKYQVAIIEAGVLSDIAPMSDTVNEKTKLFVERRGERRKVSSRRKTERIFSIQPDRRVSKGRRSID